MDTEDVKTKQVPHQIALENQTWFMLILFFLSEREQSHFWF